MNRVPRWRIAAAWAVLAILAAFSAVFAPIYYRNLQLQRSLSEITQDRSIRFKPDEDVQFRIVQRARELDLPVHADNVHIQRSQQNLRVDVPYFVRVAFPGYTVDLHFHPSAGK